MIPRQACFLVRQMGGWAGIRLLAHKKASASMTLTPGIVGRRAREGRSPLALSYGLPATLRLLPGLGWLAGDLPRKRGGTCSCQYSNSCQEGEGKHCQVNLLLWHAGVEPREGGWKGLPPRGCTQAAYLNLPHSPGTTCGSLHSWAMSSQPAASILHPAACFCVGADRSTFHAIANPSAALVTRG